MTISCFFSLVLHSRSPSCSVRDSVTAEVNQAFNFFLQNLGHTVSFSSANPTSLTVSNSITQTGNRLNAVSSTPSFGLDMKPGTGPPGPLNAQSQARVSSHCGFVFHAALILDHSVLSFWNFISDTCIILFY